MGLLDKTINDSDILLLLNQPIDSGCKVSGVNKCGNTLEIKYNLASSNNVCPIRFKGLCDLVKYRNIIPFKYVSARDFGYEGGSFIQLIQETAKVNWQHLHFKNKHITLENDNSPTKEFIARNLNITCSVFDNHLARIFHSSHDPIYQQDTHGYKSKFERCNIICDTFLTINTPEWWFSTLECKNFVVHSNGDDVFSKVIDFSDSPKSELLKYLRLENIIKEPQNIIIIDKDTTGYCAHYFKKDLKDGSYKYSLIKKSQIKKITKGGIFCIDSFHNNIPWGGQEAW